jgi:hypothetical protein
MRRRRPYSRLARRQEKDNIRKALIYFVLAIILLVATLFLGIPVIVKVAVFFAEFRSSSLPIEQTDIIAPSPPRINTLPDANKTNLISLSGSAEAGSSVEIYLNEKNITTVVSDSDSKFITEKLRLEEGRNTIYAIAIDKAGNQSSSSEKHYVLFDDQPPELTITSPEDRTTFYGEQEKSITIQGQTETGVSLTLNDRLVIVGSEGSFSTTFSLSEGENHIKLIARDRAENEAEKEIILIYFP